MLIVYNFIIYKELSVLNCIDTNYTGDTKFSCSQTWLC